MMARGLTGCSVIVACLLASPVHARVQPIASALGVAAATHPERGVPTLLWAAAADPAPTGVTAEQAARFHLERVRDAYRLPRRALADARLLFVHDTGRGGIIVGLRQTIGGVEVAHGDIKVLLDRSHRLLAVAGSPHPAIQTRANFTSPVSKTAAVAVALRTLYGLELAAHLGPSREPPRAGFTYIDLSAPGPVDLVLRRPARVKPVHFPIGDILVPAHIVEIQAVLQAGKTRDAHALIVGLDGRVLHRKNLIASESFTYRVYADADGRPLDSPLEDYNPHPAGEPSGGPVNGAFPTLVAMEGFNTNPDGVPDPWLPPGAKETLGNNVDAYVDWVDPSGLGGNEFRGKINGFNTFDYIYDLSLEPLADQTQSMAVVTSLFYVNNWLHDWFYDSGFNEAAGNAQADNFGRGGVDGDVLLAEGQDAALEGARNNANMSTPLDGESPTMQMYLWSPLQEELYLTIDGTDYAVGQAAFGPRQYDVTAPLVLVDDGTPKPNEGCEPPVNDVSGKIVLIDRGTCSFELKATHVQNAGAVGVVFPDSLPDMPEYAPGADADLVDPTIPAQGLAKANGDILKDALTNGPVNAHMLGLTTVERDGTIDNLIVAHEWGHYIHNRLESCGSPQCGGQGEGWGDFLAVLMSMREGDDLDGTYGMAPYGTFDTTGYFGLRRVAYTVDMAKNALTFRHISDGEPLPPPPFHVGNGAPNSEVHNAGEIWSTMMWEAYIALHKAHEGELTFAEVHRRMTDYVVAGMMMAPVDPTFTEQRDAILSAVHATDSADFVTIAEAFARRGAGTCAVSPAKGSMDLKGVVEDFEIRANGVVLAAAMDDSQQSCDDDGVLDDAEAGKIHVTVRNVGVGPMIGATLSLSGSSPTLVFPGGDEIAVPDLDPQTEVDLSFDVALAADPPDLEPVTVTVTLVTPDGCEDGSVFPLPSRLNGDVATGIASTDDVDAPITPWQIGGSTGDIWSRIPAGELGNYVWHGIDFGSVSDTWIISPTLEVSDTDPLVITFLHAYSFEFSDNTYWDGGIIELSTDDGETWSDINQIVDPGYTGTIGNPVNPIDARPAFAGDSPGYPNPVDVELDLGTAFAGQSIKLRFRIGTDGAAGAPGWFIDDIGFAGITNTPFSKWVPDAGCDPDAPTTSATTTDGDDDSSGGTPTSSADPSSSDGEDDDTTTTTTAGLDDEGCGCRAESAPGMLPLFGLLAFRRRRKITM